MKTIILGIPLDLGAESLGVTIGPKAFRERQIVEKLRHAGLTAEDAGDIECQPREQLDPGNPLFPYADEIRRVNEEAAAKTEEVLRGGNKLLALGGDHSINLGVFSGAAKALDGKLGLIYIDAHGDMNTPETSISHNIHGMHVASLMGFGPDELVNTYGPGAKLDKNNLLHIGASDLDKGEEELIARENLKCFTMLDVLATGLAPLLRMIDELAGRVENIWVSLDLDVIDSVYAPGVGIPNRGGLTYREIAAITEYIGRKCNVVGLDVVELNPNFDIDNKTAELGIELAAKLLGTNYSWYTNYMDRNTATGQYAATDKAA